MLQPFLLAFIGTTAAYNVTLYDMSSEPVISIANTKGNGYSPCTYTFNPSYVAAAEGVEEGVLLRTAKCPDAWGGETDHIMWAPCDRLTGKCKDLINDIVVPEASQDPRIVYDNKTKTYYNFYWANNVNTTGHSTVEYAVNTAGRPYDKDAWVVKKTLPWIRNGCTILRDTPPHYVVYGEAPALSGVGLATTYDMETFTTINETLFVVDESQGEVVIEAGSPPIRLASGDYFHLYAAGTTGWVANGNYTSGYVILDGADPNVIVQKSTEHLLISQYPYQNGLDPTSPYPVQRKRTLFACTATLLPQGWGPDSAEYVRVWFGAADASVGTAVIRIEQKTGKF